VQVGVSPLSLPLSLFANRSLTDPTRRLIDIYGQCGHEGEEHVSSFKRVLGDLEDEKVVEASCGTSHTLFLTESGKVYAVGTGEKGVLGNGKTGEHIAASRVFFEEQHDPLLVEGAIKGKKIVQITSGQQHNLALDSDGYVYAWGYGGKFSFRISLSISYFLLYNCS